MKCIALTSGCDLARALNLQKPLVRCSSPTWLLWSLSDPNGFRNQSYTAVCVRNRVRPPHSITDISLKTTDRLQSPTPRLGGQHKRYQMGKTKPEYHLQLTKSSVLDPKRNCISLIIWVTREEGWIGVKLILFSDQMSWRSSVLSETWCPL